MTQNILSAMDSDNVNSIDDTVESIQVADVIKESFFDMLSQREWPFLMQLSELQGLSDINNPTKMQMPSTWNKVKWLKYNKKDITYLPPTEFSDLIDSRTATTGVVNSNGYVINSDPLYWTTYDDKFIYFDGYNSNVDSTLQGSKTKAYVAMAPLWTHSDSFIPDIPEKFFPALLSESKAQCFINLKQQQNMREERKSQRNRMIMRNEAWRNEYGEIKYNTKVNYGRK